MSDKREPELREIENECPQCGLITGSKVPGPSHEHEITGRLCLECLDKNCWTDYWDYWEDNRPMEMTPQEASDTYDEDQERARRRNNRNEGRE